MIILCNSVAGSTKADTDPDPDTDPSKADVGFVEALAEDVDDVAGKSD